MPDRAFSASSKVWVINGSPWSAICWRAASNDASNM